MSIKMLLSLVLLFSFLFIYIFVLSLQQYGYTEQVVVVGGSINNVSIMCVICDVFYSFQSLLLYENTMII
jgi:hypothetical protein